MLLVVGVTLVQPWYYVAFFESGLSHHFKLGAHDLDRNLFALFICGCRWVRLVHLNCFHHTREDTFASDAQDSILAGNYLAYLRLIISLIIDRWIKDSETFADKVIVCFILRAFRVTRFGEQVECFLLCLLDLNWFFKLLLLLSQATVEVLSFFL